MNLPWFYEQWFECKGAPKWEVSWQQLGETVRDTILQQHPYFRANVEVLIEGASGPKLIKIIELRREKAEFSFSADFRTRTLIVDPHFLVLHHVP